MITALIVVAVTMSIIGAALRVLHLKGLNEHRQREAARQEALKAAIEECDRSIAMIRIERARITYVPTGKRALYTYQ